MEALIRLDNVHKRYAMGEVEVHALRGLSMTIEPGDFVAIMGPSGSGKSTLMYMIGCLDRPTSGRYILDGIDMGSRSRDELADIRNRYIGFVFQSFNLLARTSALENVELPLIYSGMPAAQRTRLARAALERLGLAGRERHYPSQLSGGQQQRVAIARAIVNEPPLLLADEPTGNLDDQTSREMMEIFLELNRQGKTIVMITHETDIAAYAKRTVVLRDGNVVDVGAVR
jgi:putative ABC transport system ATP-binding protein